MMIYKLQHVEYVQKLNDKMAQQTYEHWLSEHLRMNGLYWGIMTLVTLKSLDTLSRNDIIEFIKQCYDTRSGGFGAYPQHDAHILSTLSAIQVLAIVGALQEIDDIKSEVVGFIAKLQLSNGSFQGDSYGETDTRFVYSALNALSILGELDKVDIDKAVTYLKQCENFDGAFGMRPGAESHAAQVFTVVAALGIVGKLDVLDQDKLSRWLSERQVKLGGLNGRPEKLPDVCYSWWIMSPLTILHHQNWIDLSKLQEFILQCQDETGGISDRSGNETDIYHTCFGLTALSLIDHKKWDLEPIDPVYCMPSAITKTFKKWPYN